MQLKKQVNNTIPLVPVSRNKNLPLSFEQERLWALGQLIPNRAVHNITQAIQFKGKLNIEILQKSVNEIIRRHEALRTNFTTIEGSPVQVITPDIKVNLNKKDFLYILNIKEEITVIQEIVEKETQIPFNLQGEPLFNFKLIKLGQFNFVLVLRIHHIIADGISMNLLIEEIATLYETFSRGNESALPKLDIQYRDFAVWQRQRLQGIKLEKGLSYWRKQLDGVSSLKLPIDRPKPLFSSFRGAYQYFKISPDIWSSVKDVSNKYGVTPFMTLLTGFNILLHHYCKQTDITVASPVSGRVHPQLQSLIGFFAYPILLRNDLSGNSDFEGLLKRVRKVVSKAYAYQNIPLSKVVEATKCEGLVRVFFSFLENNFSSINLPELTITPIREATKIPTDMDLFLTLYEVDEELRGVFEYNPDLFDEDTVIEFINSYCLILETCVNFPQTQLDDFILTKQLEAKVNSFFDKQEDKKDKLNTIKVPKVAITASFTTEPIADSLDFWLRELDLNNLQVGFAPYNQVFQQLYAPDSLLSQNNQGINVVLLSFEDWVRFEYSEVSENSFVEKIEENVRELIQAFKTAILNNNTPLLLCLCPGTNNTAFLQQMEVELTKELADVSGVYVVNSNELINNYPVEQFYDSHADKLGHVPFTQTFYNSLGTTIARKIHAIRRNPYKVIVLDCDRTLWDGICGEDGISGITVSESFQKLQKFAIAQRDKGMLLCLCSKNNQEDVWEVFEQRSDMLLKREHLVSWRINWKPKSDNLKSLAQELQLGLDSFIFIDDNPVECAEVEANCPSVLTLQLPEDIKDIPRFLQHVWVFDCLQVTQEDKQRTSYYQQNIKREQLRASCGSLRNFINSLNLDVQIMEMESQQISRVSQLTQRTNQFNATTIRRSESEIQSLDNSLGLNCVVVHVKDRFGDYGLVGAIIFAFREDILQLEVDTLLLSCRVLGRGVEHQLLAKLGTIAIEAGLSDVLIKYKPSNKNQPVLNFLNSVGEEFRKNWEDGYCFELPSSYCSGIAYNPELTTVSESLTEQPEKSTSIVPIKSNSSLMNRIANQLYDIEKISQAIESQKSILQNEHDSFVFPSTDIQKQLVDLWAKILHLEKVGIKDNFFDLGGNSLIAVQLMSQIRETFQVDLPLSELLTVPTVEQLALSIEATQKGEEITNSEHSFLDLDAEVNLDPSITPPNSWKAKQLSEVEAILLTGATGFLGAFLLTELLQQTNALIYCLVRSLNSETGQHKIKKNLEKYQIWSEDFSNRIIPIPGDLSLPLLGLSEEAFQKLSSKVEIIYHNGAFVNFVYPYFKLKVANVRGTEEVLRLATQIKVKPVHFISTVNVFDSIKYSNCSTVKETDLLPEAKTIYGGYAQTKWVAEKLVKIAQSRGIPICIYRPGAITGNSHTGDWNTDDAICRILRGIILLKKIPILDTFIEMIPVDYVAKALVYLSGKETSFGKNFHLINPQLIYSDDLANWIKNYGYHLQKIDYSQWQQELIYLSSSDSLNPLTPLMPLFFEKVPDGRTLFEAKLKRPVFNCENTFNGLADSDIYCPPVKDLLEVYFSYLIDCGLLEKPLVKF